MTAQNFDTRLTRTEAQLEALHDDVKQLATSLRDHTERIESHIDKLMTDLSARGRVNWNVLISACFLVVTLVGAAFTPIYMLTSFNKEEVEKRVSIERFVKLEMDVAAHHAVEGHPGVLSRVAALDKGTEGLKTQVIEAQTANERRLDALEKRDEWFMRTRVALQAHIAAILDHLHMPQASDDQYQ